MGVARASVDAASMAAIRSEAADELQIYRARMPVDMWARSLDVATNRLLRERLHLPILEL